MKWRPGQARRRAGHCRGAACVLCSNSECRSAAQPQPNVDAENTARVAWKRLSRAALYEATSSPEKDEYSEWRRRRSERRAFESRRVCAACTNLVA